MPPVDSLSAFRILLICTQAILNHLAFTPPNRSVAKGVSRFNTDQHYLLQIAPLIAKLHQRMVWVCAGFEITFFLTSLMSFPSTRSPVCLVSQPNIRLTPFFCVGWAAVVLGAYIRLECFGKLKELFTFDLTIHPDHRLITDGLYNYVRHPAYTGSLLITAGLALTHMSKGNWPTECGPLLLPASGFIIGTSWFLWTLAVGLSRVEAEDKQLRKMFPEWDAWAARVRWWFLPGLI
ncbi:protein-S-isoprenylcysteine O-methyltransferase [Favolaschia claudopus]|uniref:Protein-S-isoprenylcysteine O-methyltransferase n=1 Tax=Favolaschia claudopus TaxID=2862362 RepID=A0AAW0B4R1_9AGAR